MSSCCPKCSKREQERESGIVWEWTRGFCLPGTSEDSIALHRCHRTHHRNVVYSEGTITGKQGRAQSMQCTIWCMIMTWQYVVIWANATSNRLNEVGLNLRFKFKLHMWRFKCQYMICPKQQPSVVLTCMKMVQMDRLDFSDHFSYINYFIWSYGWISMIFRSLGNFLDFLNYFKSRK